MSYNLMAESSNTIDWLKLQKGLQSIAEKVEIFPIPGESNFPDSLGLSIIMSQTSESTWAELKQIIEYLDTQFQLSIYDLYSGEKIGPTNMDSLKEIFLE